MVSDGECQKAALLQLMESRDERSNRVNQQIHLLQAELARVSQLELCAREERSGEAAWVLESQRRNMVQLLLALLDEKAQRSKELHHRLEEMERAREDNQVDYWLAQYQRLLENKPDLLAKREAAMDVGVGKVLAAAGATDYLPAFARHRITDAILHTLTEEDLQKMGMYQVGLRKRVLEAIEDHPLPSAPSSKTAKSTDVPDKAKTTAKEGSEPTTPNAPPIRLSESRIEARVEAECAVCLEADSDVVFVPCGHVCCCEPCCRDLQLCPLCRAQIAHRVHLGRQPNLALNLMS